MLTWIDNRHRTPAIAGVVAPPAHRRAPIWAGPVPVGECQPLAWLLGAHGGAGVSCLERCLPHTVDCGGRWPAVIGMESRFVVVVARETIVGITAAHDLLRQHACGLAGPSTVLGLVTVAARPGRLQSDIRRYRSVVAGLVEHSWRVNWHNEWLVTPIKDLPEWNPDSSTRQRSSHTEAFIPGDVVRLGTELDAAVRDAVAASGACADPEGGFDIAS
ncbi:DUF6668 family protein [Nocardia arthritidis]|uniref:DUF6668 family protein n=1 Tax=Nocardia arthritidis TaxID=228602 RepID=UPI0031837D55